MKQDPSFIFIINSARLIEFCAEIIQTRETPSLSFHDAWTPTEDQLPGTSQRQKMIEMTTHGSSLFMHILSELSTETEQALFFPVPLD